MAPLGHVVGIDADIHAENRPRPEIERNLAAVARRQHGVVALRQLVGIGVARGAISYRIKIGRLHPIHRGVYGVGHAALTARGRWMAAVLACGEGAVLSHRSAAALWGFLDVPGGDIDVTAPGRSRGHRRGIRLHAVRRLRREDAALRDHIPMTTVARTLLDLSEVLSPRRLERALEEVEGLRLFDASDLERVCQRSLGRRGLEPLRALLATRQEEPPDVRSELERAFHALCREARLPVPVLNASVTGFVVDALWPQQRLIVELDGFAFHRSRSTFESDRERDAWLQLAGYSVLRITWRRLHDKPREVAGTIRAMLDRRGQVDSVPI